VAVVLFGNVLQLFQIERDDLGIQGSELLRLDIIVGLIRDDSDLWDG
jgi:hypothetical protein